MAKVKKNKTDKKKIGKTLLISAMIIFISAGSIMFIYGLISRDAEWEFEVVVSPNYPSTYHSIDPEGHCETSWLLYKLGLGREDMDYQYFVWETIDGWREAPLEVRYSKSRKTIRKPAGAILQTAPPAIVDLRTTDGSVRRIKIKGTCTCLL